MTTLAERLAAHPLEASLIRLAVLGSDGFELAFDEPQVLAVAGPLMREDGFDDDALRPIAARGFAVLERAAATDERLGRLLTLWRPRALRLLGRLSEVRGEDALRLRLEDRLGEIERSMVAARAAGDEDLGERLHARYIELGTTYAARLKGS